MYCHIEGLLAQIGSKVFDHANHKRWQIDANWRHFYYVKFHHFTPWLEHMATGLIYCNAQHSEVFTNSFEQNHFRSFSDENIVCVSTFFLLQVPMDSVQKIRLGFHRQSRKSSQMTFSIRISWLKHQQLSYWFKVHVQFWFSKCWLCKMPWSALSASQGLRSLYFYDRALYDHLESYDFLLNISGMKMTQKIDNSIMNEGKRSIYL